MASLPFEQTLAALRADDRRHKNLLLVLLCLALFAWLYIAWRVALPIQLSSSEGGVVSAGASISILSTSNEPVRELAVSLGQQVAAGDLLLQFDVQDLQVDLDSKLRQLDQQAVQIQSVAAQRQALVAELSDAQQGAAQEIEQLRTRRQQTLSKIDYARKAAALYRELRSERRIDRLQYEEAAATLAQEELELAAVSSELGQAIADKDLGASQSVTQQAALQERHALLQQQATDLQREIDQLQRQISQANLVAPTAAVVGDLAPLAVGSLLPKDQWAMTLIPEQPPEFRAKFPQRFAGGQVQVGQPAQIELFAFPWGEYGTVPAAVARVGRVASNGLVEVVFSFELGDVAPLQHQQLRSRIQQGLQGRVRVEVGSMTLMQRFLQLLSRSPAQAQLR